MNRQTPLIRVESVRRYEENINELQQPTSLSTCLWDCRTGTGWKTLFVSVCGNLQHIWQNIGFLHRSAVVKKNANIAYTNDKNVLRLSNLIIWLKSAHRRWCNIWTTRASVSPGYRGAFHLNKKPSLRFRNIQWQNGTLQHDRPCK
jgi:hypothetical protein